MNFKKTHTHDVEVIENMLLACGFGKDDINICFSCFSTGPSHFVGPH
jgi:hypothetical protein